MLGIFRNGNYVWSDFIIQFHTRWSSNHLRITFSDWPIIGICMYWIQQPQVIKGSLMSIFMLPQIMSNWRYYILQSKFTLLIFHLHIWQKRTPALKSSCSNLSFMTEPKFSKHHNSYPECPNIMKFSDWFERDDFNSGVHFWTPEFTFSRTHISYWIDSDWRIAKIAIQNHWTTPWLAMCIWFLNNANKGSTELPTSAISHFNIVKRGDFLVSTTQHWA
jgi:hypothetical protein